MAYSQTPIIGVALDAIQKASDLLTGNDTVPFAIGTIVDGSDGRIYVYAKANATITASTAVCTVNATTFLVTATGGAYKSPTTAMVAGDYGWFSKAGV